MKGINIPSERKNSKKISYDNIKKIKHQAGIKIGYTYNTPSQYNT